MNIEMLEQYKKIKKEIKSLEIRVSKLQAKKVVDSVVGSSLSFPYTQHVITIDGVDVEKMRRLRAQLRNRRNKLRREMEIIEAFVDTVEDSDIRQIIEFKYVDGLSWKAVDREVYGYSCGDRARKKITRFFAEK